MITLLTLLLAPLALAGEINCSLNSYYSHLTVSWNETQLKVRVETPRGYSSMPQFEAPMAPEFFYMLERQAKELESLGKDFTYTWARSQCEFSKDDPWLVYCHGKATSEKEVKALSFTTAKIEEKSLSGAQTTLRARFIFDKESMYFAAIPFPLTHCRKN
jgi:hypothetical protein